MSFNLKHFIRREGVQNLAAMIGRFDKRFFLFEWLKNNAPK